MMRIVWSSVRRERSLEELLYPSENADSGIVIVRDLPDEVMGPAAGRSLSGVFPLNDKRCWIER